MTYLTKLKRIKSSIQDSIQKSFLKIIKVCEISLSKIECKMKIAEKHYYIKL